MLKCQHQNVRNHKKSCPIRASSTTYKIKTRKFLEVLLSGVGVDKCENQMFSITSGGEDGD